MLVLGYMVVLGMPDLCSIDNQVTFLLSNVFGSTATIKKVNDHFYECPRISGCLVGSFWSFPSVTLPPTQHALLPRGVEVACVGKTKKCRILPTRS